MSDKQDVLFEEVQKPIVPLSQQQKEQVRLMIEYRKLQRTKDSITKFIMKCCKDVDEMDDPIKIQKSISEWIRLIDTRKKVVIDMEILHEKVRSLQNDRQKSIKETT